ncbi:MAG: DUF2092 domain-containing protein [Candidatus Kapabacteria bacterium]|nr:DUF2092 domain-containing protein [Candidatus Kapabacteria bacterium]
MKLLLLLALTPLLVLTSCSTQKEHDAAALAVLDSMSAQIGNLNSVSFTVMTTVDHKNGDANVAQRNIQTECYMVGPNKLHLYSDGDSNRVGYWYNGKTLTYYSYAKNTYVAVPAPGTILATIDSVHNAYGVDFPAADFFYPSLSADIATECSVVKMLGKAIIQGVSCDHIMTQSKDATTQIWISRGLYRLPVRLLIEGKNGERYEATMMNWILDPVLDDEIFEFVVPEGATKTTLTTVHEGDTK